MTKVVFVGSAEFSLPSLLAIQMAHDVVGVVTQPDRPAGRGRGVTANPVKRMALAAGIPLFQPPTLRTPEAVTHLAGWEPDLIVVVAFGQILRQPVLELPHFGCINVHASLLPRWRGAAPIPAAILAGDEQTGVTIIKMDAGLDTGPILARQSTLLETDDTAATLSPRLAEMGAQLLIEILPGYLDGDLTPRSQPEAGVTYAPQLSKSDGWIDWTRPVAAIDRQVRAFHPWPGAFTTWRDQRLKILELLPLPDRSDAHPPGTVFTGEVSPLVATGSGAAWLMRVQLASKKPMSSDLFSRGRPEFIGSVLGN